MVSDPRYLQWMQSFGQTTHLPAHASTAGASTVMSSSATVHAHLNLLGPAYFRMPPKPVDPSESSKTSVSVQQAAGFKCPGHNLLKYLLVPLSRQGLEAGMLYRCQAMAPLASIVNPFMPTLSWRWLDLKHHKPPDHVPTLAQPSWPALWLTC